MTLITFPNGTVYRATLFGDIPPVSLGPAARPGDELTWLRNGTRGWLVTRSELAEWLDRARRAGAAIDDQQGDA
jgi:hypothetical protein